MPVRSQLTKAAFYGGSILTGIVSLLPLPVLP